MLHHLERKHTSLHMVVNLRTVYILASPQSLIIPVLSQGYLLEKWIAYA